MCFCCVLLFVTSFTCCFATCDSTQVIPGRPRIEHHQKRGPRLACHFFVSGEVSSRACSGAVVAVGGVVILKMRRSACVNKVISNVDLIRVVIISIIMISSSSSSS